MLSAEARGAPPRDEPTLAGLPLLAPVRAGKLKNSSEPGWGDPLRGSLWNRLLLGADIQPRRTPRHACPFAFYLQQTARAMPPLALPRRIINTRSSTCAFKRRGQAP